jgi:hypothetical protein
MEARRWSSGLRVTLPVGTQDIGVTWKPAAISRGRVWPTFLEVIRIEPNSFASLNGLSPALQLVAIGGDSAQLSSESDALRQVLPRLKTERPLELEFKLPRSAAPEPEPKQQPEPEPEPEPGAAAGRPQQRPRAYSYVPDPERLEQTDRRESAQPRPSLSHRPNDKPDHIQQFYKHQLIAAGRAAEPSRPVSSDSPDHIQEYKRRLHTPAIVQDVWGPSPPSSPRPQPPSPEAEKRRQSSHNRDYESVPDEDTDRDPESGRQISQSSSRNSRRGSGKRPWLCRRRKKQDEQLDGDDQVGLTVWFFQ